MAETSGFFEAMYDEQEEIWDRTYLAEQFANYFKLFVGNGVFISPTNQLKVIPGVGLSVMITKGWAFINGYWYHNSANVIIDLPSNNTYSLRRDSIILRMSQETRDIKSLALFGTSELSRGDATYDIKLAEVEVGPGVVTISESAITDTRPNENVCGFVKGLMKVEETEDLFSQYNSMFNDWFQTVKDQVTGDLAIRLQQEFVELNQNVDNYYSDTLNRIDEYNTNYQATLNETRDEAEEAKDLVDVLTQRDYIIPVFELSFVNNVCNIPDDSVTETTLIDVYFTQDSINEAMRCVIYVESEEGNIKLTAERTPKTSIKAAIGVRVR